MPAYTIVVTGWNCRQEVALGEFPDDVSARSSAQALVTSDHASVAVARGLGGEAQFLGAWDWNGGAPRWTAET
jgi:hypothetical protein